MNMKFSIFFKSNLFHLLIFIRKHVHADAVKTDANVFSVLAIFLSAATQ